MNAFLWIARFYHTADIKEAKCPTLCEPNAEVWAVGYKPPATQLYSFFSLPLIKDGLPPFGITLMQLI